MLGPRRFAGRDEGWLRPVEGREGLKLGPIRRSKALRATTRQSVPLPCGRRVERAWGADAEMPLGYGGCAAKAGSHLKISARMISATCCIEILRRYWGLRFLVKKAWNRLKANMHRSQKARIAEGSCL